VTAVLDRVPLERIGERAARARPGVVALTVVAAVLFGLGWAAWRVCAAVRQVAVNVWRGAVWCGAAVAEGWVSARAAQRGAC
jgi:hypothetical protein